MTKAFSDLADFIENRMRMSHLYQPVMLMALLNSGGKCSEKGIAKELLAQQAGGHSPEMVR